MNAEEPLLVGAHDNEQEDYGSILTPHASHSLLLEYNSTLRREYIAIIKSVGPLALAFFLQQLLPLTTIYATGRLGPRELAAATLAVCTFNITGVGIYQGMSTCLDSLCSQAYGAGKLTHIGVYFQRCSLMLLAFTVFPLGFIWWFSGPLLTLVIPDQELAYMAQSYLRILAFGAPGLLFFETGKRFLQSQKIFHASTYILLIIAPLNVLTTYILVLHPTYGLGFIGAPISVSIIYWSISICMFFYVYLIDGRKCWGGFDIKSALSNWTPMLHLALPGVVMVEAEYLAFQVLTIFASRFGTNSLAAQSIASNVGSLLFQLPFASAVAISTRIGHYVGLENIFAAKIVANIGFVFGALLSVFNFSIAFFFRRQLGLLLTDSEEVLAISDHILVMLATNQIADTINVVAAGILRGQGRQKVGSLLNLVSYYVFALPVGYYLAFFAGYELTGLWVGIIIGVVSLAITQVISIYFSDWPKIIRDSRERHDS